MVKPIPLDNIEIREGLYEEGEVAPGTYTVRKGDDAVTYEAKIAYHWIFKEELEHIVCSECKSMGGEYETYPGGDGDVHDHCECRIGRQVEVKEIGRRQGADCERCNQFFYTSDMKNGYCLDCWLERKEALDDYSTVETVGGLVLEIAGAIIVIAAGIAEAPVWIVVGGVVVLAGGTGQVAGELTEYAAKDPPDESYKELVELMEVDSDLEPVEEEVSNLRIMEAVKATTNVIANLDAYRRSMEKFTYATGVFDRKYISLHGKSVIKYKEGIITSLREQIESYRTFGSALKDTPYDIDLKPEHINEFQAKLEAEGFDEQKLNLLQKFGLDTDAINELKEKILNTDPGECVGKLSGLLNTFVTKTETFKDNMMSIG